MTSAEGVERRRYARQRVHALAYVELGQDNGGIVLNVSEGGLAVAAATPMTGDALPRIRFRLPGSASWIETAARVAWIADTRREAGVVFLDLPAIDRTRIQLWIVAPEPVAPAAPARLRELTPPPAAPEVGLTPEPPLEPKPAAMPIAIDRGATIAAPLPKVAASLPDVGAARIAESWLRPELTPRRWLPLLGLVVACVLVAFFVGIMAGRGSLRGLRVEISRLIALPASNNAPAPPLPSAGSEPPNVPATGGSPSASNAAPSPPVAGAAPAAPPALAVPPPAIAAAPIAPAPSAQPSAPASSAAQPAPSRPDQTVAPANPPQSPPQNPAASSAPSPVATAVPISPPVATAPPVAASTAPAPQSATAAQPAPAVAPSAAAPVVNPTGTVSVVTDVYPSIRLTAATSASRSTPLQLGALTSRVEPVYPPEALRRGVQGTVVLHILIGTEGTVTETQVVSGPQALIEAARDAVGRWRYQPTLLGNQRVETEADATITFRLTTPPASPPASGPAPAPAP